MSSAYVVTNQRAKTERIRFLLRSWYNTADVDARTQNPDLRLQQLKMSFVAGTKPLQKESQEREEEAVHTNSFCSAKPARRRENAWYTKADVFSYPKEERWTCKAPSSPPFRAVPPQNSYLLAANGLRMPKQLKGFAGIHNDLSASPLP